jgi:hypothetical protein
MADQFFRPNQDHKKPVKPDGGKLTAGVHSERGIQGSAESDLADTVCQSP